MNVYFLYLDIPQNSGLYKICISYHVPDNLIFRAEQTVCIHYRVTGIFSDSKYRIVTFEYESLLVSGINVLASDVCYELGNGKYNLYSFELVTVTRYS